MSFNSAPLLIVYLHAPSLYLSINLPFSSLFLTYSSSYSLSLFLSEISFLFSSFYMSECFRLLFVFGADFGHVYCLFTLRLCLFIRFISTCLYFLFLLFAWMQFSFPVKECKLVCLSSKCPSQLFHLSLSLHLLTSSFVSSRLPVCESPLFVCEVWQMCQCVIGGIHEGVSCPCSISDTVKSKHMTNPVPETSIKLR